MEIWTEAGGLTLQMQEEVGVGGWGAPKELGCDPPQSADHAP